MENGHLAGKPRTEKLHKPWRQRNLRHQENCLFPALQRVCRGPKVHLGLTAAGYPVE